MTICMMALFLMLHLPLAAWADSAYPNRYQAEIIEITDGDTFKAKIYSWPQHFIEARIRLRGIDTPEIRGKCDSEKQLAKRAKKRLQELTPVSSTVFLHRIELGTYAGRVIADVANEDYDDIGEQLLKEKLARPYDIRKGRQSWC